MADGRFPPQSRPVTPARGVCYAAAGGRMQDGRRWWLVDEGTADALRAARPPTALQRLRASAVVVAVTAPLVACNAKSGIAYEEPISDYPGGSGATGTPTSTSPPTGGTGAPTGGTGSATGGTGAVTGGTGAATGGTGAQPPGTGN